MSHKLLIIDDDDNLREGMVEVLELDGFDCFEAANAKEGIDCARKEKPDAVICDIQLPDSSGFQIAQELRKDFKDMVLVMMTGRFLSSEEKTQGINLGADDYFTKPFNLPEVAVRLKQLIKRKLG